MEEVKWVETKKECEVDEVGNLVVRKVTLETEKKKSSRLERKDIIDLTLRVVGLLAIGIPVLLFYFQQKVEREKQRALLQIEVYSEASMLLHQLLNDEHLNVLDIEAGKNRVFYQYYPKIALYNDEDTVTYLFQKISYNLPSYLSFSNIIERSDSLNMEIRELNASHRWPNSLERLTRAHLKNDKLMADYISYFRGNPPFENRKDFKSEQFSKRFAKRMHPIVRLRYSVIRNLMSIVRLEKQGKRNSKEEKDLQFDLREKYHTLNLTYKDFAAIRTDYRRYLDSLLHKMDSIFIQSNRYLND